MTINIRNEISVYEYNGNNALAKTVYFQLVVESHISDSDKVILYVEDMKTEETTIPVTVYARELIAALQNTQNRGELL